MASRCSGVFVCALRSDGQPTTRADVEWSQGHRVRRRKETTRTRQGAFGGVGCGSGWPVLHRDAILLVAIGQSQGPL